MGKKALIALFMIAFIFTKQVMATTFRPIPLEKLIEESTSAAEVELKSKRFFTNQMGLIFTEYTFIVKDSYNLAASDLDGEFLKLTMTGGSVDGVTSYIDGAPEFEEKEKSFLLLKKVESKLYLSNFTMGKYKIQEKEGKTFFVSSVFPNDPDLGEVKKERMIDLIKMKFKITDTTERLPLLIKEKRVFQRKSQAEFRKRIPAHCDVTECPEEHHPASDGLIAMWAFLGLFACTSLTIWWKLKKSANA